MMSLEKSVFCESEAADMLDLITETDQIRVAHRRSCSPYTRQPQGIIQVVARHDHKLLNI